MKRFLKWAGWILASPIILFVTLTILLYIPPVQDLAVRAVTAYVEDKTGCDIQIERLRITFPLDLDLQKMTVVDAESDTILDTRSLIVDLDMTRIFRLRVGVDAVELDGTRFNIKELIPTAQIKGSIEQLRLDAHDIELSENRVHICDALLEGADIEVALRDTIVPEEEEEEPTQWVIDFDRARIMNSKVKVTMAGDTLSYLAALRGLDVERGHLELGPSIYEIAGVSIEANKLAMNDATAEAPLEIDNVTLKMRDVYVATEPLSISLPSIELRTPTSYLTASADANLLRLGLGFEDAVTLQLNTELSRSDILAAAAPYLPSEVVDAWPEQPLKLSLEAAANSKKVTLRRIDASIDGALALDLSGRYYLDSLAVSSVNFGLQTTNIDWLRPLAGGALDGITLPPMALEGVASACASTYGLTAKLNEGDGEVGLRARIDTEGAMSYEADLDVHDLNIKHFLKDDSLGVLTATASLRGAGTDWLDRSTVFNGRIDVARLDYGRSTDLGGTGLEAQLANGRGHMHIESDNKLLRMSADLDAVISRRISDLTFGVDLSAADMYALGISSEPLSTSMCLHVDGRTNLSDRHSIDGTITDIILLTPDSIFRPEDMDVRLLLRPDTTMAYAKSGDLFLLLRGRAGYERLLSQLERCADEVGRQLKNRRVDMYELTHHLPQMDLRIMSGQHNPFHDILAHEGYDFETMRLNINLDPFKGVNGSGLVTHLNTGTMFIDTIDVGLQQPDAKNLLLKARVHNDRRNPQFTFDARMDAMLNDSLATASLSYLDERGRTGVRLGLQAFITDAGYLFHVEPLNPIVAFRQFHLNDSNYVLLGHGGRIDADIDLLADDGTGLKLYSTPNSDALQDLSVSINRLNMGELTAVLPYFPRMTGFMHGDAHLVQTEDNMSISADLNVNDMTYEGAPLGEVGIQAVYLPNADGSHLIDGSLLQAGTSVAEFTGVLIPTDKDTHLNVEATLERLPLSMANGFISDGTYGLNGFADGELSVSGTTDSPLVNGVIRTDSMQFVSDIYSLALLFANQELTVNNSAVHLDRIPVYSGGDKEKALIIDGDIDFSDLDHIGLELDMAAKDYALINAKRSSRALVYGKMFIDFTARLRGTLDNLNMFGRMNILGNTDLTYVLDDSPLTVEDQLSELVTFVDFTDSMRVFTEESQHMDNLTMMMNVQIDDAAHLHVQLSPDRQSYVDVEGGGNLNLSYTPEKEDLQLNGRYTINTGTIKYTMMVIPLKEFNIRSGSYLEFRGPMLNPTISLSATERMRTTVTQNEQPRSVNFNVGMNVSQTLEKMGLEFTLEAPEDMTIQNELAAMTTEQRSRLAVTMLATGMYITDASSLSGSGGFSGQNALNSFLQSQISNIAGKALKSVDISMGVESGTTSSGATTTDYSFRFAKRFWGNRISVIVGGKVSTGQEAENTGLSIVDNVSLEYRLDKAGTRSVSLFYDKNFESLLDGEIIEMGAGLIMRRKSNHLKDLFLFRTPKEDTMLMPMKKKENEGDDAKQ